MGASHPNAKLYVAASGEVGGRLVEMAVALGDQRATSPNEKLDETYNPLCLDSVTKFTEIEKVYKEAMV